MWEWCDELKLGKSSPFVKRELRELPLTDAEFEADFFLDRRLSTKRRDAIEETQQDVDLSVSEWGRLMSSLCAAKQQSHVRKQLMTIARKIANRLADVLGIDAPPSPNPR